MVSYTGSKSLECVFAFIPSVYIRVFIFSKRSTFSKKFFGKFLQRCLITLNIYL